MTARLPGSRGGGDRQLGVLQRGGVPDVRAVGIGPLAVDDPEPLIVRKGVGEGLGQRAIGGLEVVIAELGQGDERVSSLHAGRQLGEAALKHLPASLGEPGGPSMPARPRSAVATDSTAVGGVLAWRGLIQLAGGRRRAAFDRSPPAGRDRVCRLGVVLRAGEREVARTLLRIIDQTGRSMCSLARRRRPVILAIASTRSGCENRTDSPEISITLAAIARSSRSATRSGSVESASSSGKVGARSKAAGSSTRRTAAGTGEPLARQALQRRRQLRIGSQLALGQPADQLEGLERIAAGHLMDALQHQSRQGHGEA